MLRTCFHVTTLSNFARGFQKYSDCYSKIQIPESTFPDQFFLLFEHQLEIGFSKASQLLAKLSLPGDELIVLETQVLEQELFPNERTGLGQFIKSPSISVDRLYFARADKTGRGGYWLELTTTEEAMARSLALHSHQMVSFAHLRPRSFSILPIAKGCQAQCRFCFSEASASAVLEPARLRPELVEEYAMAAAARGAERYVITGGGEPGLVPHSQLLSFIRIGRRVLGKVVLITNGYHLAQLTDDNRQSRIQDYADAGLGVLAVSRHHHDDDVNSRIMNLRIDSTAIARSWQLSQSVQHGLRMRFVCVLQSRGISCADGIASYLTWASSLNVEEVCFKELYVSTSTESVFHAYPANQWSRENRVPLSIVVRFAETHNFTEVSRLPWGSPVYAGEWHGRRMMIAAYTEPSLYWERTHGVARSWNQMANGECLASLEDRASLVSPEKVSA